MQKFTIKNIGKDLFQSDLFQIGSNVIHVEIEGSDFDFPMVAPHQSEFAKAKSVGVTLESPLLQFIHRIEQEKRITNDSIMDEITEKLVNFFDENPNLIVDSYFQFWQEFLPTDAERGRILDSQYNAGSLIISDYETEINQSVRKFENQLNESLDNYPKNILSPTIDMALVPVEKLEKKIDLLFKYGIKRFNVIYRSMIDEQDNWITLSKKIYGKNIWCNVVGVPTQYYSQYNKFSLISAVFFYGAHTASLQYPRFPKSSGKPVVKETKKATVHLFEPNTGYFEIVNDISDERARALSINELVKYSKKIQPKIISKSYYSKFVPTQTHLNSMLQSIM